MQRAHSTVNKQHRPLNNGNPDRFMLFKGTKKIHLLLPFTKFASHIQTELLNVTVSYEEKRGAKRLAVQGKGGGWEEIEIFPHILKTITSSLCQKALFLERGLNGAFYVWLSTDTKKQTSSYLTDFLSLSFLHNF